MAVLDRTSLNTQADTNLPDNTTRFITPALLRTIVKNIIDSCFNRTSDPVALGQKITEVEIAEGDTTINHTLAKAAQMVVFIDSDGNEQKMDWVAVSTTGITVTSTEALSGVTVKIVAF